MEKDNLSVLLEEHGVIAADSVMRGLFQKAAYLAKMDATVLLSGEVAVEDGRVVRTGLGRFVRRGPAGFWR